MLGTVFINYRRGEDSGVAGRLFDQLELWLSADRLFMDVDSIPPGCDFVEEIKKQVARCDVFLAVIGKSWSDVRNDAGRRRLEDPHDWVRIEIESALKLNKTVVPILVSDTRMPLVADLPGNLKLLANRNAMQLRHESFRADVERLRKKIEPIVTSARQQSETASTVRHRLHAQQGALDSPRSRGDERTLSRRERIDLQRRRLLQQSS